MNHELLNFHAQKPLEHTQQPLELWGGVECTVNRVQDEYFDQSQRNGHAHRESDLDLFAELGIRALRYPILWERTAPQHEGEYSWAWSDARLARLRELGIAPIATLLHHGSGPRYTDLLDPQFPEKLARYARDVAQRYPWISHYTPVNEPLTTARFSALYGHWYPHHRSDASFARALWNQCRGVQLAMREIHRVNPAAKLVQTEDMGRVFSTRHLAHQAHFENERRWLSFDLLCGRVDREHIMANYLRENGISESELDLLCKLPEVPAIFGINYYATSERFLDERIERYPAEFWGSNGREEYADVEAARVLAGGIAGPRAMLLEAWNRYQQPLAITEAHLGCTREEQMRWLLEVWREAQSARLAGADVRAVTLWALLGTYDWNSLLTRCENHYEPGAFDLRVLAPDNQEGEEIAPRRTAIFHLARELASGKTPRHSALSVPGWWHREARLLYPAAHSHQNGAAVASGYARTYFSAARRVSSQREYSRRAFSASRSISKAPILILGNGVLARAFEYFCEQRHLPHALLSRDETNAAKIERALQTHSPWALIDCQGNGSESAAVVAACARRSVASLAISCEDEANDTQEIEARVLAALPKALLVRSGALFDAIRHDGFVAQTSRALENGKAIPVDESLVSLSYAPDLANVCLDSLLDGESGLRTLENGTASFSHVARVLAHLLGADENPVQSSRVSIVAESAPLMPPLENALARYIQARREYSQPREEETPSFAPVNAERELVETTR